MTSFTDNLKLGAAVYQRALPSTGYAEDEFRGIPVTQMFAMQLGTASTALASGIFFSASGATGAGTLTITGALVSGGVATFDVARGVRITSSVDLSTNSFSIRGTDYWGAPQTWTGVGPTGNTLGNTGSFVDTSVTFKTVTSASGTGASSTTAFLIGNNNQFGLPYRLADVGKGLDGYINGSSASVAGTWVAGLSATAVATATTVDVRGSYAYATTSLADGSKRLTAVFITPNTGIAPGSDTKENTYGVTPFNS